VSAWAATGDSAGATAKIAPRVATPAALATILFI
jgi:hypothetical protein